MAPRGTSYRIAEELRSHIRDGRLQPGMMLPSESDLVQQYAVARGTVRSALEHLAQDELIEVVPGIGRRVAGGKAVAARPSTAYERIAADLADRVRRGEFPPKGLLPSEADLISEYEVSRNTVRRAYRLLVTTGLVEIRHGAGAFVRG